MLNIVQEPGYNDDDVRILTRGLDRNAFKEQGHAPVELFAFFLRDADNKVAGGCNGQMYYGCLFIDQLWIDDQYRNQGYGSKLLKEVEDLAISKGCLFSTLETMDWQSLAFYKKHNYLVEFERKGYLKGAIMYGLRKNWY